MLKLQNSARNSTEWFETLDRYLHFEPIQFAYSLLTRSQRVSHENLRLRDKAWLEGVERWFQSQARGHAGQRARAADVRAVPAARHGARQPRRRLADGDVFGRGRHARTTSTSSITAPAPRAAPASLYTEMTCVSPEGRITPGCAGLYAPEHVEAWRRIVDFVHAIATAKFCLQLGHSRAQGLHQGRLGRL